MKLAIVGSSSIGDHEIARQAIYETIQRYAALHEDLVIVTGGAKGIDSLAELVAAELNLPVIVHRPQVRSWRAAGGFQDRNRLIAQECDALVRIVHENSRTYGSGWTRDEAGRLGKPTMEVRIKG